MWDSVKLLQWAKCAALNPSVRKPERLQVKNLNFYPYKRRKKNQIRCEVTIMNKTKIEINEVEKREIIETNP